MGLSMGIGDAFLMSKLAWTLAQAFTKGRKAAPREFQEVENQLYSLSAALNTLRATHENRSDVDTSGLRQSSVPEEEVLPDAIQRILINCQSTLDHLKTVLKSYGVLTQSNEENEAAKKKWIKKLSKEYKSIAWTSEKGDLDSLRTQLIIHTNSLDLILGVINNFRTTRIEESQNESSEMIKEIYDWFRENITGTAKNSEVAGSQKTPPGLKVAAPPPLQFELHTVSPEGVTEMICPNASLNERWEINTSDGIIETTEPLFTCHCALSFTTGFGQHSSAISVYQLSSTSFGYRLLDSHRSWILYNTVDTAQNRKVPTIIRNLPLHYLADFERNFIHPLSEAAAESIISHGQPGPLARIVPGHRHGDFLNMRGDLRQTLEQFEAVSFSVGGRTFKKEAIKSVSLHHYRKIGASDNWPFGSSEGSSPFRNTAEITILYDEDDITEDDETTSNLLEVKQSTRISHSEDDASVSIYGVKCLGYTRGSYINTIESVDVKFQFAKTTAANHFDKQLEDMRMELFILNLQYPQQNEEVALHLKTAQVQSKTIYISDAEIFVCKSEDHYRLIIVSRNRNTILSQIVAKDFLAGRNGGPNFAAPTYLVQSKDQGKREVEHLPEGLKMLRFQSVQAERMLEIGWHVVFGGLPIRSK